MFIDQFSQPSLSLRILFLLFVVVFGGAFSQADAQSVSCTSKRVVINGKVQNTARITASLRAQVTRLKTSLRRARDSKSKRTLTNRMRQTEWLLKAVRLCAQGRFEQLPPSPVQGTVAQSIRNISGVYRGVFRGALPQFGDIEEQVTLSLTLNGTVLNVTLESTGYLQALIPGFITYSFPVANIDPPLQVNYPSTGIGNVTLTLEQSALTVESVGFPFDPFQGVDIASLRIRVDFTASGINGTITASDPAGAAVASGALALTKQ